MAGSQKAAPLGELTYIKGEPVDLERNLGKKVFVIEFWATWCPPCRASVPHLSELQKKFRSKNVEIIGITNEDNIDAVRNFVTKMGDQMDYTVAVDTSLTAYSGYMERYHIYGIPHAFIVNKNGMIQWHGHPMSPEFESEIQRAVNELASATSTSSVSESTQLTEAELQRLTHADLQAMSVHKLKEILRAHKIDTSDVLEKNELIQRIEQLIQKKTPK
jgi:thiol-disulfide isomerase/thioredoxin